ncbi:MAG: hypothetical protein CMM78_04805 [Rhodospirillaceae bacterium]|nr:hypothetical protein [Rhodospirillales bacterium]MAX47507.1 hypothetical protein [Rhodospirillaceae bacterium]|tara:strand:- start:1358 stop:1579 length:222 start_codon:yes stop_codon:yes gene_type:complete
MFFVGIGGVADSTLAFLGYTLVTENEEFKKYHDYQGEIHVVLKSKPMLKVDDMNDAMQLQQHASGSNVVRIPD